MLGYYARILQMNAQTTGLTFKKFKPFNNNSTSTIFSVVSFFIKIQKTRKQEKYFWCYITPMISNEHYIKMLWLNKACPHLDSTFLLRYKDPGILKAEVVKVKLKLQMF